MELPTPPEGVAPASASTPTPSSSSMLSVKSSETPEEVTAATPPEPPFPLFSQSNVRKHEYWQFTKLIAPAHELPEHKKTWTADDAVGIWCLRCAKSLPYQKGNSQSIRYHMETKHASELTAFRAKAARIKETGSESPTVTSNSPSGGTSNGRGIKRKEDYSSSAPAVGLYEISTALNMDAASTAVAKASPASSVPAPSSSDELTSWHRNVQRRSGFWGNAYWYDLQLCRRMPLAQPMLDELILALPPCDSKRVVDLCAGSGRASAALLAAYPTAMVTLMDSSSERLGIAQKRLIDAGAMGNIQFVAKAIELSGESRSETITNNMPADVVVGCLALHVLAEKPKHYEVEASGDQQQAVTFSAEATYERIFQLIYNSLAPGGHLVFADHVGQLGLFKQLQLMAEAGFVDVDCAWRQEDSFVAGGRRPMSFQGGIVGMHSRSRRGSEVGTPTNNSNSSMTSNPSAALMTTSAITGRRRNCIAGGFPGPKARPSVIFSGQKLGVTVGGCAAFYSATLSCVPEQPVTISPVNPPACIRVSPSLLVFDEANWSTPQFFRVAVLSAVYDDSNKDDRKLQVIEHVSSSEDIRFSGNRIMYLPPNLLVQVSSREGCYLFTSGTSIGTTSQQQLSSVSQTLHEFAQVELGAPGGPGGSQLSGSRDLHSRSSVASNQSFSAAPAATGVEVMNTLAHATMVTKRMSSRRNLMGSSTSSASLAPSIQSSADGYYHSVTRDGVTMVKAVCRAQHTVVLYKSGKWGLLGKMVVDYTSEERDKDTTGVNGSRGSDAALSNMLVDVDCGDAHLAALTEQGYIMTWGEGHLGRLGHGNEFSLRGPQAIKSLFHKRIVHLACGAKHTVAAAEDGDVYSWGYGKCGALGHGLNAREQSFESVSMPMEILTLKGKGVSRVSCGDAHTAVVLQNGTLLTCGWSEYGRLGRGQSSQQNSEFSSCFENVDLKKKLCTFVACGAAHTLVLTECKALFAFGWNVNGQLGLGDRRNRRVPTQLHYFDADELVLTSISAGKLHSMALTQDARVFAWGSDELGQCGIGSFPQIYTVPHLVASTVGVNVAQVSAGEGHSVVLTTASQKQLDAMQSNHPTRYATLLDNYELFVKSDAARQIKVLTHAKEAERRRKHAARTRKPPIDPSSSLARTLQLQCRVQSDMAQFGAAVNTSGRPKSRAGRPHTASAVLSSRSLYSQRDEKDGDSSARDVELVSPRADTAGAATQERVRCSSATMWRQTRLFTFQSPEKQQASAKPMESEATRHHRRPLSANTVVQAKLSADARKSLASMLNGDAEPQSALKKPTKRPATGGGASARENGNQQCNSIQSSAPCSAQQPVEPLLASFPLSRPRSAPSQTRRQGHHQSGSV